MSVSTTTAPALRTEVKAAVLGMLAKLRLPELEIVRALEAGEDPRIPSRKAMVIIARVHKHFGLKGRPLVKKEDLKPDQVTSVRNLIDLLTTRLGPALGR
ncbi:MAG: hypothetical protein M3Q30_02785 [Actinomycetota bacterium]|nr:hypothetical protein [Actinomycetota bacterium]